MSLPNSAELQLERLYGEIALLSMKPLWEQLAQLVPPEPAPTAQLHKWSYDGVRDYLMRAGDLISAEKAERRVLILENPGLPDTACITPALYAGLQLILPGEVAPCHRHSQSALRFVLEGEGGYTAVDGEKAVMAPFDLVLTPGGQWHDHGNPSTRPMIWLDGLDIPIVRSFDAGFAERLDQPSYPESASAGDTLLRYGSNLAPIRGSTADRRPGDLPLFHYPHSIWRPALEAMAASADIDLHLGHALEFRNPATGGAVMHTVSAHVRQLPKGFETKPRRSTEGAIFVVVAGRGEAQVGEETIVLEHRDILVVPAWKSLVFRASKDLVLFGFSDRASQEKLNLYRESLS